MSQNDGPVDLIRAVLSESIARAAVKAAKRSTINSYKTGAVIFDKHHNIKSIGVSHIPLGDPPNGKRSVHAEDDALSKIKHIKDRKELNILVFTLNHNCSNVVGSSRPCLGCARRLTRANLKRVYYLERDNSGSWHMNRPKPATLLERGVTLER
jgi:deoxycytidylate deaminase